MTLASRRCDGYARVAFTNSADDTEVRTKLAEHPDPAAHELIVDRSSVM